MRPCTSVYETEISLVGSEQEMEFIKSFTFRFSVCIPYACQGVTAFDLAVAYERSTTVAVLKDLTGGITAAQLQEGTEGKATTDVCQRERRVRNFRILTL